jgi:hypothetical protein
MKNLSIVFVAALSLMSVAGCKKKGGSDAMAKSKEFADRVCACADKKDGECFKKVQEEMGKWAADNADKMKDYKPTEEEQKQATEIAQKMSTCMQKAMTLEAPAAGGAMGGAPAAGGSAAAAPAAGGEGSAAGGSAAAPAAGGSAEGSAAAPAAGGSASGAAPAPAAK